MTTTSTLTMTAGVTPHSFDVRCDEHGLDLRGYAYGHAITAMTEHKNEHPKHHLDEAVQALIAQAIDYSAAADKCRTDEAMEAAYTEGVHATIKALAIVAGVQEADAHEMFMEALDS